MRIVWIVSSSGLLGPEEILWGWRAENKLTEAQFLDMLNSALGGFEVHGSGLNSLAIAT